MSTEAAEEPTWRKTLGWAGWTVAFLVVTLVIFTSIAVSAEPLIGTNPIGIGGAVAISAVLAFMVTKWWRYQVRNKEQIVAARERREAEEVARSNPKGDETFDLILKALGVIVGIGAALYVASLLPVSLAIVIGAVIIGGAILLAASR